VIPLWQGVVFGIFLLIASVLSAYQVGGNFVGWLVAYFVITSFYSWGLKKIVLLDCLILAILYTLRIVAGGFAVGVPVSFWLLAFSIFLFLSLAFVKRYAELMLHHSQELDKAHGRGYYVTDAGLIQQLGVTSGYAAVLVLALYLNSENVIRLYKTPEIIWGAIPAMLMWLSWMWLQAQRKKMHDDPIVFAIKDKVSIAIGLVFVACFLAASL
jgi:4-hydroxybenzoate polyprenyltransferase